MQLAPDNSFTFSLGNSGFFFVPGTPVPGLEFTSTNITSNIYTLPNDSGALAFSGDNLNGIGDVSGVNFELNSFDISPVPLPSALPMLGTALIGLGAFAWRRRVS